MYENSNGVRVMDLFLTEDLMAAMVVRETPKGKWTLNGQKMIPEEAYTPVYKELDSNVYDRVILASPLKPIAHYSGLAFVCKSGKWGLYSAYMEHFQEHILKIFSAKYKSLAEILLMLRIDLRNYSLEDTAGELNSKDNPDIESVLRNLYREINVDFDEFLF